MKEREGTQQIKIDINFGEYRKELERKRGKKQKGCLLTISHSGVQWKKNKSYKRVHFYRQHNFYVRTSKTALKLFLLIQRETDIKKSYCKRALQIEKKH